MRHKRNHYRPAPFCMASNAAEFINRHIRIAFDEFLDIYFPDAPKSLRNRLSPSKAEWEFADLGTDDSFFYIKFICDIDADPMNKTRTGTLSLVSEMTDGLDAGHYRSIQVEDDNQEYFCCLYYKDIQTAVKVCELLNAGKNAAAMKIALSQPDTAVEWAYKLDK